MSKELIQPYQGTLSPLLVSDTAAAEWRKRATQDAFTKLRLSSREAGDLDMLGMGAFSPLTGFMSHDDWREVCRSMHTASGLFWPIPITLATSTAQAASIKPGEHCQLLDRQGDLLGILRVEDKYQPDQLFEAAAVFGTTEHQHPGVANLLAHEKVYLAGEVTVLQQSKLGQRFPGIYMTPQEARAQFSARGWSKITAFQTRNPMHRAHEYLVKLALETCDGVFIHSLLGNLKPGDIPAAVRMAAIESLIKHYFVSGSVINAGYSLDMRYAGPREALLHALFRQNFGCSHIIIGRDHAGVGSYYEEFAAQEIFAQIPKAALQIEPLKFDWTFWCHKCDGMASARSCPHASDERLLLSGTELRRLLSENAAVPAHYSRPEVLSILQAYYKSHT